MFFAIESIVGEKDVENEAFPCKTMEKAIEKGVELCLKHGATASKEEIGESLKKTGVFPLSEGKAIIVSEDIKI